MPAGKLLAFMYPELVRHGVPEERIERLLEYRETVDGLTVPATAITSTSQPVRRLLTDGQVIKNGQLAVNGGSWVIDALVTPSPIRVRITRLIVTDDVRASEFLSALARIIRRDNSADYMFAFALEEVRMAQYWIAGRFMVRGFYPAHEFIRRDVHGLTADNHLYWTDLGVPNTVLRLIEQHGPLVLQPWMAPWQNTLGRILNQLGDFATALDNAKLEMRLHGVSLPYSGKIENLPLKVRPMIMIHGQRLFDALGR